MEWLDWVYIYIYICLSSLWYCFVLVSVLALGSIDQSSFQMLYFLSPTSLPFLFLFSFGTMSLSPLTTTHPLPSRGKKCRLRKCPLLQPSPIPPFSFLVVLIYISHAWTLFIIKKAVGYAEVYEAVSFVLSFPFPFFYVVSGRCIARRSKSYIKISLLGGAREALQLLLLSPFVERSGADRKCEMRLKSSV